MAEQIKIILPEAVKKIINVLQSAGYYDFCETGAGESVVSSYSGYRYSAWNSHCFDG